MNRFLSALLLVLLAATGGWATDYYVRTDGSDSGCTGLADAAYDGSGTGEACAWLTLGKAWQTADTNTSSTIHVGAGDYYAEVQNASGGPSSGVIWTYQFAAAQSNVRMANSTPTYVFRFSAGRTGTAIFQGGSTGAAKTTKFDLGTDGAGAQYTGANSAFWYLSVSGSTFQVRDCEVDGDAAGANTVGLWVAGGTGVNFLLTSSYVHGLKRTTAGAGCAAVFRTNYFYNPSFGFTFGNGAESFTVDNNTIYTKDSANPLFASNATKAGAVRLRNNLLVSEVAVTTSQAIFQNNASQTLSDFQASNNWAWKTGTLSSPRQINNYPFYSDATFTNVNTVVCVDPAWTGTSTAPSVGATSLTIGRGTAVGITTDFAGAAYPSASIGASAVAGGTKQYLTKSAKSVLMFGDSWVAESPPSYHYPKLVADALAGSDYTTVKMPGQTYYAGLTGQLINRYFGMATELVQANSPGVIIIEGGLNDKNAGWSGASIAATHKALADAISSLYAAGDAQPIILDVGAQPDDGLVPTTTVADAQETALASLYTGTRYRSVQFTASAKTLPGGIPSCYTAGDAGHPNADGYDHLADWLLLALTSGTAAAGPRSVVATWAGFGAASWNAKACTDVNCSTGCSTASTGVTSPATISGLTVGTPYYACVQGVGADGKTGVYVASSGTATPAPAKGGARRVLWLLH